jgi:two-component sensor histidine kinase
MPFAAAQLVILLSIEDVTAQRALERDKDELLRQKDVLIVTELVINSLKHAFDEDTKDGQITVAYDVSGTDWKLSVADNGIGRPDGVFAQPKTGLGTGIVKALAKQLDSQVVTSSGPKGTTVSVTHATFGGREERLEAVS